MSGWTGGIELEVWSEHESELDEFEARAKEMLEELIKEYPGIELEKLYVG